MAVYEFNAPEDREYEVHPDGLHAGTIVEFRDLGLQTQTYNGESKEVHRCAIVIESDTMMPLKEGQAEQMPFQLWSFLNLASGPRAKLTNIRQQLLKKQLTREEMNRFDPNEEMVGKRLQYVVVHNTGGNGKTYANIQAWMPLDEPKRNVELVDKDDVPF